MLVGKLGKLGRRILLPLLGKEGWHKVTGWLALRKEHSRRTGLSGDLYASQDEVLTRHTVDAREQDGELRGAVGIGAAQQQVTGRIESQLPARVGAAEIIRADERELVVVTSG